MSDSLRPSGLQHARLPCPSLSPRVCSDSRPLSRWCHSIISSSHLLLPLTAYTLHVQDIIEKKTLRVSRIQESVPCNQSESISLKRFPLLLLLLSRSSCVWLCHPVDYSTPGFPVLHQLPEFAQTHVPWVSDAILLILCHLLFLLPSIFPSIRVFSNEWTLLIRWPKYWSLGSG